MPATDMSVTRNSRLIKLFLLFFAAWLTTACSTLVEQANIQEPTITLEKTRVAGLSLEGVDLMVSLNVQNPNPFSIKLAGFDYSLSINNHKITGGQKRDAFKINSNDVAQIELPVKLNFTEIFKLVGGLTELDAVGYQIDATAYIDVPVIGVRSISTTLGSEFPLPKRPTIGITGIRINSFSFAGAKAIVGLRVANPNSFGIDMNKLDYRLTVGNEDWARANIREKTSLAGGGETEIELPIEVNFFDMGGTVFKVLKDAKPLDYRLQGDMLLDTELPMLKNLEIPFDHVGSVKPEFL